MMELLRTEYEKGKVDAIAEMQKPWSEEDESLRRRCIGAIEMANLSDYTKNDILSWLKSPRPQKHEDLPRWRRLPLSDVCYTDDSCCVMDVITSTVNGNSTAVSSLVKGNYYVPLFELENLIKKAE